MKTFKLLTLTIVLGAFAAMLTAAAADANAVTKPYPLTTCVVSGEKLGEMGSPYVFTNSTQEVKLCCKSCLKDFNKDPKTYMKKIEAAKK